MKLDDRIPLVFATITPPNPNSVAWDRDLWAADCPNIEKHHFGTLEEAQLFVEKHLGIGVSGPSLSA
jgi:hypothetical protein